MRPIKTILHPTDFSANSQQALEIACMLACDANARLLVLHVVPRTAPVVGPGDVSALRQAETRAYDLQSYRAEMMDRLHNLPMPGFEIGVERILEEGDVARSILRVAEHHGCDLIIMGAHGGSARYDKAMGSVAETVTRQAPCPVLTLRLPARTTAPAEHMEPEEAGVVL